VPLRVCTGARWQPLAITGNRLHTRVFACIPVKCKQVCCDSLALLYVTHISTHDRK
jgi:hypothetical protein